MHIMCIICLGERERCEMRHGYFSDDSCYYLEYYSIKFQFSINFLTIMTFFSKSNSDIKLKLVGTCSYLNLCYCSCI